MRKRRVRLESISVPSKRIPLDKPIEIYVKQEGLLGLVLSLEEK